MAIATINPTTKETIKTFLPLTDAEIEVKLALAVDTFLSYRQISIAQRSEWLQAAAQVLESRKIEFGKLMTLEMGKTLKSAIAEVEKSAWVCRYYAENAAVFLADVPSSTDASESFVRYEPMGPILAVMPWNFPFWQVFRFAAPALAAGNVGLLKHASNVPQCALAIEEVFLAAGFPQGCFQTLLVGAERVASLIEDVRVKAATLTGSEPAGMALAAAAGKAIKKTVLELGGSDPFIVLSSANVREAAAVGTTARMLNNGQSCIAAKRFIVVEAIADEFEREFVANFAKLQVGDPMLPETDIGPLATEKILADIERQVEASLALGAKLLIGGKSLTDLGGYFYAPTILTNISVDSPAYREEFFGPVALLFRVPDFESAIALANDTSFGLGASVWTEDPQERKSAIDYLEAGAVFVNGLVKSDPRLPFGGIKRSGYGRELGIQGMQEFLHLKTVWIR